MMLVERKPELAIPKSFKTSPLEFSVFADAKGHQGLKRPFPFSIFFTPRGQS